MTDAELDAIEKRADLAWYDGDDHRTCNQQILALVAEVRRLRAAYELQQFPQKVSPYVRKTGAEIDPL